MTKNVSQQRAWRQKASAGSKSAVQRFSKRMRSAGTLAARLLPLRTRIPLALIAVFTILISAGWSVYASLNPPSAPTDPASQSYTLADICNRLETGAASTKATTFTDPASAPDQDMCNLNDIYASTPQPDATNAAQAADVLSGKTFWALNPSGQWGLTTGTVAELTAFALLAATGQNTCYNATGSVISCAGTGQDGEYQLGATASPRFTNNNNGTITDNLTGLIWLQNANCAATLGGVAKTTTLVWADALTWSNNMASGSCGLTDGSVAGDWRLPNITELESLVDLQNSSPSLPSGHPFTSVVSGGYWSSTTRVVNPNGAWLVGFIAGNSYNGTKTFFHYVWPVR
jgi:hypothetical protein